MDGENNALNLSLTPIDTMRQISYLFLTNVSMYFN